MVAVATKVHRWTSRGVERQLDGRLVVFSSSRDDSARKCDSSPNAAPVGVAPGSLKCKSKRQANDA